MIGQTELGREKNMGITEADEGTKWISVQNNEGEGAV
jgi:hypothetical protein